jgi:rubrerythrin
VSEKDFIFSKSKDISLSGIKSFPIDFSNSKNLTMIEVPEKVLLLGKEFFGSYEVSSATGDFVLTFNNEFEAKYVVYASQSRKNKIKIPSDLIAIKKTVEDYEKYLDQILQEIKKDFLKKFSNEKNLTSVANEIFKKLNLTRL